MKRTEESGAGIAVNQVSRQLRRMSKSGIAGPCLCCPFEDTCSNTCRILAAAADMIDAYDDVTTKQAQVNRTAVETILHLDEIAGAVEGKTMETEEKQ